MLPDRVSNPGPLTYESGALPIALRGPAIIIIKITSYDNDNNKNQHQLSLLFFVLLHFIIIIIHRYW